MKYMMLQIETHNATSTSETAMGKTTSTQKHSWTLLPIILVPEPQLKQRILD